MATEKKMAMPTETKIAATPAPAEDTLTTLVKRSRTFGATAMEKASSVTLKAKAKTVSFVSDRRVQVTAASAAGGGLALGGTVSAAGFALGAFGGALVGVIPALFTFGLSIPFCAVVGGGCGAFAGAAAGGATGTAGGGAVGYAAYTKRDEIKAFVLKVKAKAESLLVQGKKTALGYVAEAKSTVKKTYDQAWSVLTAKVALMKKEAASVKVKAIDMAKAGKAKAVEVASDRTVQVTAASAAGGAVAVGAGGAGTGFLAGGMIGGAIGVIPAIFTFGLSIPVGAAIGSGCGLMAGATVGGAAGLVGGGAAGYSAYSKREVIQSGVKDSIAKVNKCAEIVKGRIGGLTGCTGGS